jgi:spectinomycin phosphotransferase
MREPPKVAEEQLRACLQNQYDLSPVTLDFLPLGLDYHAGVYRVVSEQGTAYLLKVTSGPLYEPRCLVPRYLKDQGVTSVVAPIPLKSGALWTHLAEWTVTVYPFLDGETNWTGMTDEQWKEVGTIFRQIHQVTLPSVGFETVRKETFDPAEYARWLRIIETRLAQGRDEASISQHMLRSSWLTHQSTIHATIASLERLGDVLQKRTLPYVICHADLHPANLLRDPAGHVFVIDWDEVMLAPKERDFLFVETNPTNDQGRLSAPPFFQGYGQQEIDWIALTYYRYERVVQDLIACAQEVFFRDDLGEGTKADSVQLFHAILAQGGELEAATQTSAHLPPDLTIPTRMIAQIGKELDEREKSDA